MSVDFRLDILARILELHLGISQRDNEEMFRLLGQVYPLEIRRYPSGREHNGWVIPPHWEVKKAQIRKDGRLLFDGTVSPLAVSSHSVSFKGRLSKDELDPHIYTNRQNPDALPYYCSYAYRPWAEHWGFCVPHNQYRQWGEGTYEVELETEFHPGEMLVGVAWHQGESDQTVVFNAHTCHTCQFNDGFSGVMVILALFNWLAGRRTRYSYLGLLAPEHLGSVFFLAEHGPEQLRRYRLGCYVEMVGTDGPLALQKSFTGRSIGDRIALHLLRQLVAEPTVADFARLVVNDETVWEAPGYEVPMISLSRWPYPEYHSSNDNLSICRPHRLAEALRLLQDWVEVLEEDRTIHRHFQGLVALSNPRYDLYWEHPDPVARKDLSEMDLRFAALQDYLQRFFDGRHTVFEIAERFRIPFPRLRDYLQRFQERGLVDLRPVASLDFYHRSREQRRGADNREV